MLGFKGFRTAAITIAGIELMHRIRKGQFGLQRLGLEGRAESHPFESYRQLLGAMRRYRDSMSIMGGCRLVVTPLASKLITLGAGLACFEMRPTDIEADYGVAIPHAEPTRYIASTAEIRDSKPEITAMLLTGNAYDEAGPERPHVG